MSRYYLIANYIVPPFIRVGDGVVSLGTTSGPTAARRRRLPGPKNFMICRLDASTSVRVVYYDWEHGLRGLYDLGRDGKGNRLYLWRDSDPDPEA